MFKKPFKGAVNYLWRFDKNFDGNYISYNPDLLETALKYNGEWVIVNMDLRDKFKPHDTINEIKKVFIETPEDKYSWRSTVNKENIKDLI